MPKQPPLIVVFLDIDGVLLPFPQTTEIQVPIGRIFPNAPLVALGRILEGVPEAQLVLSSTWRVQREAIQLILCEFQSFSALHTVVDFYDITDPKLHSERQHEIAAWLLSRTNATKIDAWVALDDEELLEGDRNANYRVMFEGHVVKCDSKVGLTEALADTAVLLLRADLERSSCNSRTELHNLEFRA